MWWLAPFAGAAAGYYLGRGNPAAMLTILVVVTIVVLIGLSDPVLAVQALGLIILASIGLVILYNIIPIVFFICGMILGLMFLVVVLQGIFRLLGV